VTEIHSSAFAETIHLFLDGELSPPERVAFLEHLGQCPDCQARLVELTALFTELASLDEVAPPVDIAPNVMAELPPLDTTRRYAWLGRLALLSQIVIGLALILVAWPTIIEAANNELIWQAWLDLADIARSLDGWLADWAVQAGQSAAVRWPPRVGVVGFNIAPWLLAALILGLSLGWLVGNGLLLRSSPSSLKNGGTS